MAFAGSGWPTSGRARLPDDGPDGIAGVVAIIGGGGWILQIVFSLLFGRSWTKADPQRRSADPAAADRRTCRTYRHPGTMVLALVFTAFILYYFVNWSTCHSL